MELLEATLHHVYHRHNFIQPIISSLSSFIHCFTQITRPPPRIPQTNMDAAKRGDSASKAGNYTLAITEYSTAIRESPTSPDYHIKRSTAHQRSTPPNYSAALSDAENAVIFAQQRARKELIAQAQFRRAIALFGLERYADAQVVFAVVKRLNPEEKTLGIWENKTNTKFNSLAEADERRCATVGETPTISTKPTTASPESTQVSKPSQPAATAAATGVVQTPAEKIRHDWYQSTTSITFTLLAKGVPKEKTSIDIQPRSLAISFPLANDSVYDFSLDPLYAPIDAAASTSHIMSTKIEIVLKKAQPGQKWHALESSEPVVEGAEVAATSTIQPHVPQTEAKAPTYPTSSRHGPRNWDKLLDDMTTKKVKDTTSNAATSSTNTPTTDNADEDDYDYDKAESGGDDVNSFFQKLYAGADPDTRRAMMKSFSESNGTALSTDWKTVGKGKVEVTPPQGMEERKW